MNAAAGKRLARWRRRCGEHIKKWFHFKTETLERATYLVTIVGFPLLLISTAGVFYQLIVVKRIAASQNNVSLTTMFLRDTNNRIVRAIESNAKILNENGGQFTDTQLDDYLGDFETINQVYREGLLTEPELCTSFSYYVTITNSNQEIQKYIAANSDFFGGLKELNRVVTNSKDKDCH